MFKTCSEKLSNSLWCRISCVLAALNYRLFRLVAWGWCNFTSKHVAVECSAGLYFKVQENWWTSDIPQYRSGSIVCECAPYRMFKIIMNNVLNCPGRKPELYKLQEYFLLWQNQSRHSIIIGPRVLRLRSYRSGILDVRKTKYKFIVLNLDSGSSLEAVCNLILGRCAAASSVYTATACIYVHIMFRLINKAVTYCFSFVYKLI
jgi:hypothetical protein